MWLATQHGFFSIVKNGAAWHVRARRRGDLVNLIEKALPPRDYKIVTTTLADYRWRVILDRRADLEGLFLAFADTVTYPNFKDSIKKTDQADKTVPYMRIWVEMEVYQERQKDGMRSRVHFLRDPFGNQYGPFPFSTAKPKRSKKKI